MDFMFDTDHAQINSAEARKNRGLISLYQMKKDWNRNHFLAGQMLLLCESQNVFLY